MARKAKSTTGEVVLQTFDKELAVKLTPEQRDEAGLRMARLHTLRVEWEAKKKMQMTALNAQKADIDAEAADLASQLNTGSRLDRVRCEERADFREGVARVYRLDMDGTDAVVSTRPLKPEERQTTLLDGGEMSEGRARRSSSTKDTAVAAAEAIFAEPATVPAEMSPQEVAALGLGMQAKAEGEDAEQEAPTEETATPDDSEDAAAIFGQVQRAPVEDPDSPGVELEDVDGTSGEDIPDSEGDEQEPIEAFRRQGDA